MEDTHGDVKDSLSRKTWRVLILIIMEDTHGVNALVLKANVARVLILIIMEDTHGDKVNNQFN